MERFLPILDAIQIRLREILDRNAGYMLSWDVARLGGVGEDLVQLAWDIRPRLIQVEHRILYSLINEAGLGIKNRAAKIKRRQLEEEDKEYFRSVHEALGNICRKIETGEYYKALLDVAAKREREAYIS